MSANGGPATQGGRAVVRWNATKHGLRSPEPVIPGVESKEDWQSHRESVLESVSPVGGLEETLAERIALLSWRLHRVTRFETGAIAVYQESAEDDLTRHRMYETGVIGAASPSVVRSNLKSARADHRLLKRFADLEDDATLSAFEADCVLWAVVECVVDGEMDPEDLLSKVSIPDGPEYEEWEGYEGWTAGMVRRGVAAVGGLTGYEMAGLLVAATDLLRRRAEREKEALNQVEQGLSKLSRERLLPKDSDLEKVQRYEAHLSKQLFATLHELEALQKRRLTGEATPLARLEVNGHNGGE